MLSESGYVCVMRPGQKHQTVMLVSYRFIQVYRLLLYIIYYYYYYINL